MFESFLRSVIFCFLLGTNFGDDGMFSKDSQDEDLSSNNIAELPLNSNLSFLKPKTEKMANVFREKMERIKSHLETELIILVDGSSSIGEINFRSEMKYIQKVISDVNLNRNSVRLAVITYSSNVVTHVNHLESETTQHEKCYLLHYQLPKIKYTGGATNTRSALLEAERILGHARSSALKVIFLVTDGFSNRGNPIPVADRLKSNYVSIYTFGIENGNVEELRRTASRPVHEHSYLFESFDQFESFERRALHQDLKPGAHVPVGNTTLCDHLCQGTGQETQQDIEGGCCSDDAECTCGTFTGHFSCLCPPGHYGSGLRGQGCTPCPKGTYNDGKIPGDGLVCIPCPDRHHVTNKEAATSVDDCVCMEGYIPDGKKCKVISCPSLLPPNNGYFVKKNCSNVLNAACGVRCHLGFTLLGSSVRICQKNGTWSGTAPSCQPKRCERLVPVANADMVCVNEEDNFEVVLRYNATGDRVKHFVKWIESKKENETSKTPKLQEFDPISNTSTELNYTVDTECTFSCAPGFFLVGSKSRSCLPMLRWSGLKNTCKAIKCQSLQKIENGTVTPENCTTEGIKHNFAHVCHYSCNSGYELKGPNVTNCTGRHGTWSRKNSPSKCIGLSSVLHVEAPKFFCPLNMTVPTDEGVHFATLELSLPNATDNSGKEPVVWSKPAFEKDYPLRFIIGEAEINIYSVDDTGNYALCSFSVKVEDRESPKILECESPPFFFTNEFPENSTEITWKEPIVDDNSGVPIPLTRVPSTSEFPLGTTTIVYTAKDYAGNNASCSLNITILENPCSERPEITNTLWNCSTNSDLLTCVVSCAEGFGFSANATTKNLSLNCTYSGRKAAWSPDLFHGDMDLFPECSEIVTPDEIEGEIIIEDSDELCNDLEKLSNEISNEINGGGENESISVVAICEDETEEEEDKNKEENPEKDKNKEKGEKEKAEEQSEEVTNAIRKKRAPKKKKLKISVKDKSKGNITGEEIMAELEKTKNAVRDFYSKTGETKRNNLSDSFFKVKFKLRCKNGFILKENICVKCPKGTFHNKSNATCDPCPVGQFQQLEGQMQCNSCPEGYSTRKMRRKHPKQCKKICPPGTFGKKKSQTGIALGPCTPCPKGHFQPQQGQISCEECPKEHITIKRGSVLASDCIRKSEFDDLCFRFRCRNGGSCVISEGFAHCKCAPGFLGPFCERRFNPCGSSPCYNSAECVAINVLEFECKCPEGFEGTLCEKEINECLSNPCGNHGECIDLFGGYTCNCFLGFKGENCNERISQCDELQPCLNSGTCVDVAISYQCICPEGYTGSHCEEAIDCHRHTSSEKCENEVDIPEEVTPCWNVSCGTNKLCVEQWNRGPLCVCVEGFRGKDCAEAINPNSILHFPKYGVTEYLMTDFPERYLTEISICTWIQTKDTFNYGTIFSYATVHDDNTFTLTDYSGLVLYVFGDHVVTDLIANDGLWHFVCVMWQADNGHWKIYLDGSLHSSGSGLSSNSFIPGSGKLIVGQEQDFLGGGFNELESFSGRLGYFNVWGRILDASEVKKFYENCEDDFGDLIKWPHLLQNIHGDVLEEESTFCKKCAEKLSVFRGQISYEQIGQKMIAKYECDEGFYLKFDKAVDSKEKNLKFWYRKCMKYGDWEWEKPVCSRVSCGFPGYFLSGKISGSSYLFGDSIQYDCEEGYVLVGNNTRVCQGDGTWSGEAPYCQGTSNECRKLVAPRHGSMFVYFSKSRPYKDSLPAVGDRIEFTCDKGFSLKGFGSLTCLDGGIWDREAPICQEIKCQYPEEAQPFLNKNIPKTSTFYFDDSIAITCPSGAQHLITCGDYGAWNFSTSTCGNRCKEKPEDPVNGFVLFDGRRNDSFYEGEKLFFKCRPGFILLGDVSVTCSENSSWTQVRPTICEPVSCGPLPPPPPPFVLAHVEGQRFGQKAHLDCFPGYRRTGALIIRCEASGKWSRIQNTCLKNY